MGASATEIQEERAIVRHIRRVAILGAGTMGAAIAAHAANAGLMVDLLDMALPGATGKDRNKLVQAGFERMLQARPPALMHELRRRQGRYGLVTMCIGGGMGAAGIFENLQLQQRSA